MEEECIWPQPCGKNLRLQSQNFDTLRTPQSNNGKRTVKKISLGRNGKALAQFGQQQWFLRGRVHITNENMKV